MSTKVLDKTRMTTMLTIPSFRKTLKYQLQSWSTRVVFITKPGKTFYAETESFRSVSLTSSLKKNLEYCKVTILCWEWGNCDLLPLIQQGNMSQCL